MAEPSTAETTSASDAHPPAPASSSLNVLGLTIDENKKPSPKFLDEPEDSNIQAVSSGDTPYTSATTFEELNLSPELLNGLYVEMKFHKPSKIQAVTLPMILNPPNRDLVAHAHNGSGKTTCFLLGMLSRVDPKLQAPQAFCICPTRELAIQFAFREGRMREAMRMFSEIKSAAPNHVTYTTLIDGYCKTNELEQALKMRELMEAKGLYPRVVTYNSILRKLCQDGRIKDANKLLNEMSERKVQA
ncbi:DEAD-box ATP-dependent RNA helicase 38-like [Gastrolobium bilobum]|uniref:DEAD-box ATP-dependent RNA helicase 38-like n=1 Tax=Gastrolobium bilobum TaxID=150636 RepID=UPI002AB11328|nr:DEAD-box ATP-dependent RNA helicase 38-like [Gastrolobium bilobum]